MGNSSSESSRNDAENSKHRHSLPRVEMASQRKLLELKMRVLEEQKSQLFVKVDSHLNKVLSLGQSFLSGAETKSRLSFRDTCRFIDDAALELMERIDEIPDDVDLSPSYVESRLAGTKSNGLLSSENHTASSGHIGSVVSEITALKETIGLLTSKMDIYERQAREGNTFAEGIQMNSVVQTEESQQHSEMETHLRKSHSEVKKEVLQDSRMKAIECKVSAIQSKLEAELNLLSEEIKKQEKKKRELEELLHPLVMDIGAVQDNVQSLCAQVNDAKSCAASKNCVEALKHKLDSVMKDLGKKVEDNESAIETLSNSRERDFNTLNDIQLKMAVMESTKKEFFDKVSKQCQNIEYQTLATVTRQCQRMESQTLEKMTKQCQKMEVQYQMVCRTVANRVASLEKLRNIFNKNLRSREERIGKVDQVAEQIKNIMMKVDRLGASLGKDPVGFTGNFPSAYRPYNDRRIYHFGDLVSNCGQHFMSHKGTFVAPQSGLYAAFVSIRLTEKGEVTLKIMRHTNFFAGNEHDQCVATVDERNSNLAVVQMSAGDELYVKVHDVKFRPVMGAGTSFSCFKIG